MNIKKHKKAIEGIEGEFGKVIHVNLISYSKYKFAIVRAWI